MGLKLNVLICRAPYGGNGGISNEHPSISDWLLETVPKMRADSRIGEVGFKTVADTPITMVRNRFVACARQGGFDAILMIDSDNYPDFELGKDGSAKPFWDTSFDFLYEHWSKGPCVIGAPYCGPSPHQNVYVFQWLNWRNGEPAVNCKLDMYRREEASRMMGIQPCAALPTGLILFDTRCFELMPPPHFYYEYQGDGDTCDECGQRNPGEQIEKASTEDVTATRDISFFGQQKLGYNPVFCNWDAWAGHVKQEIVGKPRPIYIENVSGKFREAVEHPVSKSTRLVYVNAGRAEPMVVNGVAGPVSPTPERDLATWTVNENQNSSPEDRARLREILSALADKKPQSECVMAAEVGTFIGQSAKEIVNAAPGKVHLLCVDTWMGSVGDATAVLSERYDVFDQFKKFCKDEIDKNWIEWQRGTSYAVAIALKHAGFAATFDLVYIDANHAYEFVKEDIEVWLPLVRDGGMICGHDYGNLSHANGEERFPGVRQAVEEIFGDDFERPVPGSSIWAHIVKKTLPEPLAPIETNGHAKPKKRKRKALAGR